MRKGGLEPPRTCVRQPLKLVRLPIPPLPHKGGHRRSAMQGRTNDPLIQAANTQVYGRSGGAAAGGLIWLAFDEREDDAPLPAGFLDSSALCCVSPSAHDEDPSEQIFPEQIFPEQIFPVIDFSGVLPVHRRSSCQCAVLATGRAGSH